MVNLYSHVVIGISGERNMKFQLKDLKSKKSIAIIIVVVAIIAGFMFYRNYKAQDFLKDLKVEYAGYSDNGTAVVTDNSSLSSFKKVAKYEAKKAHFDSSAAKTIINSASTVDELSSGEIFDSMKLQDPVDAEVYAHHMANTNIELSKKTRLKNGDKITVSIKDNSVDPYFDTKTKQLTVNGIKKVNIVSVQSFKKYLTITGGGTNHHSTVYVGVKDNSKPKVSPEDGALSKVFKVTYNKPYSNGDKFSASEKKIAHVLNNEYSYRHGIKFIGQPNKKITLSVTGLENNKRTAKNIHEVNQKILDKYQEEKDDSDPNNLHLVGANWDPDENGLAMIYKVKSNEYYVSIIVDLKFKDGILTYDNEPLQDSDDAFDYSQSIPYSDSSLTDKNWKTELDTSESTIDFNI